jgi:hypothetical protein
VGQTTPRLQSRMLRKDTKDLGLQKVLWINDKIWFKLWTSEDGSEPSDCNECSEVLEQLRNWRIPKKGLATCSQEGPSTVLRPVSRCRHHRTGDATDVYSSTVNVRMHLLPVSHQGMGRYIESIRLVPRRE